MSVRERISAAAGRSVALIWEAVAMLGLGLVCVGCAKAWAPLGWIAAGLACVAVAATRDLRRPNDRRGRAPK